MTQEHHHVQDERQVTGLADDWAPVFKTLSDPTRLRLLLAMHYRGPAEASVSDLAAATGVRVATASASLVTMADAGVIEPVRQGRVVRYRLVDDQVHRLLHHLGATHAH